MCQENYLKEFSEMKRQKIIHELANLVYEKTNHKYDIKICTVQATNTIKRLLCSNDESLTEFDIEKNADDIVWALEQ